MLKIVIIIGTRPEAIKLAPVVEALKHHPDIFDITVVSTGQHKEMLQQVFDAFNMQPDIELNLMAPGQTLSALTGRITQCMDAVLTDLSPDMVLVQGDTTTVFTAALVAFYRGIKVGHVEAGLRSRDLANPFPEEANRRLVGVLADLHFAPTQSAAHNLLTERINHEHVVVTGNTVVDALQHISSLPEPHQSESMRLLTRQMNGHRLLLVTMHRRESQGTKMAETCRAIAALVNDYPDIVVAFPVHLSPHVQHVVRQSLSGMERVHLLPPLDYLAFVHLMKKADLILTDSGGVQEEAPTFAVPVLVLRELTERPEAMQSGQSFIVGTDSRMILAKANEILSAGETQRKIHRAGNPFGDGRAAQRIATALKRYCHGEKILLTAEEQFKACTGSPN